MTKMPLDHNEFNREYINKIARDNPIVYNFLTIYHSGELTYEQTLIGMIAHLVIHNDELIRLQIKRLTTSPFPVQIRYEKCKDD